MLALNDYENAPSLSDSAKAAIAFAEELTLAPATASLEDEEMAVSKATQDRLKNHFDEDAILELMMGEAVFNYMTRLMRFLDPDVDMELPPEEFQAMMGPTIMPVEAL